MSPIVTGDPSVQVTVIINTKDRAPELRRALDSVHDQRAPVEVLVIDDGSTDDTAAMVGELFPTVRVYRQARSVGLVVGRNLAARIAQTPVLVVLDDDVVLDDPGAVLQVFEDLRAPQIGVVAMPVVDVNPSPTAPLLPPDHDSVWVTATWRGGAHAVRRDAFLSLGGYRESFFHQGEEADVALRMLDRGWFCRVGRCGAVYHYPSPIRSVARMDVYGRRNEVLHAWLNMPMPFAAAYMLGNAVRGLAIGLTLGRPLSMIRGILRGLGAAVRQRHLRRPVRRATMLLDRRLRRERVVRLEDACPGATGQHAKPSLDPPIAR